MDDLQRLSDGIAWLERQWRYRDNDTNRKNGVAAEIAKNHIAVISRIKQYCEGEEQVYSLLQRIEAIKDKDLRSSLRTAFNKPVLDFSPKTEAEYNELIDKFFEPEQLTLDTE